MALEPGPERCVRTPGARERDESRDVANVSVTKGCFDGWASRGGRCGSRDAAAEAEKVSFSDMLGSGCSRL